MRDKEPKARQEIRDFPGLMTNISPPDMPAGAAVVQTNVTSSKPSTLELRPGYRVVTFEDLT